MREEPEFFHNKWCATRLCLETMSLQCSSNMCFATMEDKNGNAGYDFGDILSNLIDRRLVDDILLFANLGPEAALRFNTFVKMIGDARFRLNGESRFAGHSKFKNCRSCIVQREKIKSRFINIQ